MDVQIVIEGDVGVEGGVHPAGQQHLDGLVQGVHPQDLGAVALGQGHVRAGDGVGRGLAGQVLKAGDVGVVFPDGQGGVDVGVGLRKIVALGPLLRHFDAVADDVVAAGFQAGEQAVPFALHILGLQAQIFGNGPGHLPVVAHPGVGVFVVAPGRPGAFQGHDQGAALAGGFQPIGGLARGGGGRAVRRAGGRQDGHQGNKALSLHTILPLYAVRVIG